VKRPQVDFRPESLLDVDAYYKYLVREAGAAMAARFADAVFETAEGLARFPRRGPAVPHLWAVRLKLRSQPVSGFKAVQIYYRVLRARIVILRVIDVRRDLRSVFRR
jgi:plasmid stabilization system protein ParE